MVKTDPLSSGPQLQSCTQQNPDSDWPRTALPFFSQSSLFPDPMGRGLLWRDSLYLPVLSPATQGQERPGSYISQPLPTETPRLVAGIQPKLLLKVAQGQRDLKTKALGSGPIVKTLGSKKGTASIANFKRVFQNFYNPQVDNGWLTEVSFHPNKKFQVERWLSTSPIRRLHVLRISHISVEILQIWPQLAGDLLDVPLDEWPWVPLPKPGLTYFPPRTTCPAP